MSTWTEEALEMFMEEISSEWYGNTASYGAFTFQCILNPIRSSFSMKITAYSKSADTIIDLLRTDAVTNGLYELAQQNPSSKRPIVNVGTAQYEIIKLESDDPTQPSIRLSASLKQ